jgi:hypothetical protein
MEVSVAAELKHQNVDETGATDEKRIYYAVV